MKGWEASTLSLAGRLTLTRSVTSAMVNYPMQHDSVPEGILDKVERIQHSFIWGDSEGGRMWHAITWETMCRPKEQGGVGLKSLRSVNDAFLSKILWRLHTHPSNLWAQVLLGKYGRGWNMLEQPLAKGGDSRLWKELVRVWGEFDTHLQRPPADQGEPSLYWNLSSHGEFTVKSV